MPNLSTFPALFLLAALAGCGPGSAPLRVDARHPASPHAPEGRPTRQWVGLQPDEFDQAVAAGPVEVEPDRDMATPSHEQLGPLPHRHHVPGSKEPAPKTAVPSPKPSAPAGVQPQPAAVFACPMHREVTDTMASECPKCRMKLVRRKEKLP